MFVSSEITGVGKKPTLSHTPLFPLTIYDAPHLGHLVASGRAIHPHLEHWIVSFFTWIICNKSPPVVNDL